MMGDFLADYEQARAIWNKGRDRQRLVHNFAVAELSARIAGWEGLSENAKSIALSGFMVGIESRLDFIEWTRTTDQETPDS